MATVPQAQRLRPTSGKDWNEALITAEQAPLWARLAELEQLRRAKAAKERVDERLQAIQPRQVAQDRSQVAQKPLETALERHQAAPPPQPLPPPYS